jgi:hypothetical protein
MDIRRVAGALSIAFGIVLVIGGIATWLMVSSMLADQRITIPDDGCLAGRTVSGPLTAYCQAMVIDQHALDATDGQRYAELDREDPRRDLAMNASFLQASLFTSVVAFGVAAMAIGMGVLFVLLGLGMRDVREQLDRTVGAPAGAAPDTQRDADTPAG